MIGVWEFESQPGGEAQHTQPKGRVGRNKSGSRPNLLASSFVEIDPKRTRQMIRLAGGVVFDYVVPIFNMATSTAQDSNGA